MLLLIGLLSTMAATMSNTVQPTPLKPIGSPGDWVTTDDYPKSALRTATTGTSHFRLDVDAQGNVSDCNITQSSGNDGLDATACALLKERAHFIPATDGNGRPIAGNYSSSVRWQMPSLRFPLSSSVQTVAFDVDAEGTVSDCKGDGVTLPGRPSPEQLCSFIAQKAEFDWGEGKKPAPKHVVVRSVVEVTDRPARIDSTPPHP